MTNYGNCKSMRATIFRQRLRSILIIITARRKAHSKLLYFDLSAINYNRNLFEVVLKKREIKNNKNHKKDFTFIWRTLMYYRQPCFIIISAERTVQ